MANHDLSCLFNTDIRNEAYDSTASEEHLRQGMKRIVPALIGVAIIATTTGAEGMKPVKEEMMMIAHGTFEVKMTPRPEESAGGSFGQFFLDKKFQGDLDGASKGHMLASGGPPSSYGGYVALEQVTGTLGGKRGSFVLMHRGTMGAGSAQIDVSVVPGSGAGELKGISGTMKIIIEGSKHSYEFSYVLL